MKMTCHENYVVLFTVLRQPDDLHGWLKDLASALADAVPLHYMAEALDLALNIQRAFIRDDGPATYFIDMGDIEGDAFDALMEVLSDRAKGLLHIYQ